MLLLDDGSKLAKLMKVFTKNDVYDEADFPVTSEIKARFKNDEGGTVKDGCYFDRNGYKESEEIGEKRGEKRGREEGAKIIAKTMIEEGLPTELIMRYTGLSEEAVAALQG